MHFQRGGTILNVPVRHVHSLMPDNEQGWLTLGAHAQRGLRYLVCVSACLFDTQHLTFHVFFCVTSDTNLLGGR